MDLVDTGMEEREANGHSADDIIPISTECDPEEEEDEEGGEESAKRYKGLGGEAIAAPKPPTAEDVGKRLVESVNSLNAVSEEELEQQLTTLVELLDEHIEQYEGQIIQVLAECASFLPERLTIFTTVIGLLNAKSTEFGKNMLARLILDLEHSFAKEDYAISIRLVTFLCDLANAKMITAGSVADLLDSFVQLIGEEGAKSDFFVYLILHTLPWVGSELQMNRVSELQELLARVDNYLGTRKKLHVELLRVWSAPPPFSKEAEGFPLQEDYLDSLWTQTLNLKRNDWRESHIVRIYGSFQSVLSTATPHELPGLDLASLFGENSSEEGSPPKTYPLPRMVFHLFEATECGDDAEQALLPAAESIERFLVEEDLNWILDNNYLNFKLCAETILKYHRREFIPLNICIVEAVFGQLFRLPQPPHLELFYGALLIELCRLRQETMPRVLAMAVELLYFRADAMQPICVDRFVNWFSYHLSNLQYRWSWADWAECVKLDTLHPRRIFVREVIEKCLCLSFYKRIIGFLPSEFEGIIPEEPQINYELDDENHPLYTLAQQLKAVIQARKTSEEILPMLKTTSGEEGETEANEAANAYDPDAVAVFIAVLLKLASKTFSHSFAALTRYHSLFRTVGEHNEEVKSLALRVLYECWNRHKQMMTVLVDKMLKMQIIDSSLVESWVFSDEMKPEFKRSWIWCVLSTAINRLEGQRRHLEDSCGKLKQMIESGADEEMLADDLKKPEKAEEALDAEELADTSSTKHPKITAPTGEENKPANGAGAENPDVHSDEDALGKQSREEKLAEDTKKLAETERTLRALCLSVCHRFVLILSEHLLNCENDGTEVETEFYNYVLGRLKYIFLTHAVVIERYVDDLEKGLFSPSLGLDARIASVFQQFRSLKF